MVILPRTREQRSRSPERTEWLWPVLGGGMELIWFKYYSGSGSSKGCAWRRGLQHILIKHEVGSTPSLGLSLVGLGWIPLFFLRIKILNLFLLSIEWEEEREREGELCEKPHSHHQLERAGQTALKCSRIRHSHSTLWSSVYLMPARVALFVDRVWSAAHSRVGGRSHRFQFDTLLREVGVDAGMCGIGIGIAPQRRLECPLIVQ